MDLKTKVEEIVKRIKANGAEVKKVLYLGDIYFILEEKDAGEYLDCYAYVYNVNYPELSEYGSVGIAKDYSRRVW